MKHLRSMEDLSKIEIEQILDLAKEFKYETRHHIRHTKRLDGKALGMIFSKSSSRTRVSFETGMFQLGGHALFLSSKETQLGRGESIKDSARVFGRLTDYCHPCQVLADLQTILEYKGKFDGLKMCYIGDGNNMANSLIVGGLKMGMEVACATAPGYEPCSHIIDFGKSFGNKFMLTHDCLEAAKGADAIFTDVWASMGQEDEKGIREKAFKGFCIDDALMSVTNKGCIVQHCLPAHKGEEISEKVFEEHATEIFDEAENRLHAQKAVLYLTMHD